jgi:GDP-L-fucose synthase
MSYLNSHGVENRPIISGNFVRQPLVSSYLPNVRPENYPGAEVLHARGFFIGVHQIRVPDQDVEKLVDVMLGFPFEERHVVLVTGSNGMLGRHVQAELEKFVVEDESCAINVTFPRRLLTYDVSMDIVAGTGRESRRAGVGRENSFDGKTVEWIFTTRIDADLRNTCDVENLFKRFQPTHVLHLAGSLQALQEMTSRPVDFWINNVTMNNNVLSAAHKFQEWSGPIKLVSVLSTVMFPKDASYPVDASQALSGALHPAGEGYGLSKRALAHLSRWYREQHGMSYSTVLPGNVFGAYGDFNPSTAPLVNALVAKAQAVRAGNSQCLNVMGSGEPLRQIMHASDLARIMIWAAFNLDQDVPLLVAGNEVSIKEIARMVSEATGIQSVTITFDAKQADGPFKRTADVKEFRRLCPTFVFKPLSDSLAETVDWYRSLAEQQQA